MTIPTEFGRNGVRGAAKTPARTGVLSSNDPARTAPVFRPTWPPTQKVLEALKNLERDDFLSFVYDENELYRSISEFCGLPENYIQTYAGADVALEAVCRAYLEPGVEILIALPTMSRIRHHADSFGVRIRRINSPTPFDINVDSLITHINDFTRLLYIGQPSLPGGVLLNESEARYLLDNAGRAMVIIDESALMMRQYSLTSLVRKYHNLFIVRAFDGVYGLDAQPFGFILSHPDNLKFLERYHLGHSPHILADIAAAAVLADMDRIDERITNIHENMLYLTVRLRSKNMTCRMTPSGHILIKTENPDVIMKRLYRHGIFSLSLAAFEHFENYIMVPVEADDFSGRLMAAFEDISPPDEQRGITARARITLKAKSRRVRPGNAL